MNQLIRMIEDIILDTQNDIYVYLESEVPLECQQKDIDDKLFNMRKEILKLLKEEGDR